MDCMIATAARALAAGDPLGALNRVALRDDPAALALRGIAMAQLGDFERARTLLSKAARAFSPQQAVARARCIVAEAEVALVSRDLHWPPRALEAARATLASHGDHINAAHARLLQARRLLLIGRLDPAEQLLATFHTHRLPPALEAVHHLLTAGIAMRRLHARAARSALTRATRAARHAGVPALLAEIESALHLLHAPAARLLAGGEQRLVRLAEVEALLASHALIVDACRNTVRQARWSISLAGRPVLFALARVLAQAWPGDASRHQLLIQAFGARSSDESHRARLRVEIGRLRAQLRPLAAIHATRSGFALQPRRTKQVVLLAPPVDDAHAHVLAALADGESWSSSALALALNTSQRSVQRALEALVSNHKIQSFGRGRARRWMTPPLPGITTTLLLPTPLADSLA